MAPRCPRQFLARLTPSVVGLLFEILQGFVAKPVTLPDSTQDILNWEVVIPGKDGTLWEGARIPMTMQFTEDYPNKPPVCKFKLLSNGKPLFHPNVYPSGKICLSLLDADKGALAPPPPPAAAGPAATGCGYRARDANLFCVLKGEAEPESASTSNILLASRCPGLARSRWQPGSLR